MTILMEKMTKMKVGMIIQERKMHRVRRVLPSQMVEMMMSQLKSHILIKRRGKAMIEKYYLKKKIVVGVGIFYIY